jgi:hypothetical protein
MKKQCLNHPKYLYSGKESSPHGLGIAAEPLALGTIQEGRDKTNWVVALKNGVKVWSRITRMSEILQSRSVNTENSASGKRVEEEKDVAAATAPAQKPPKRNYNIYLSYKLKQLMKEESHLKPKERMTRANEIWKTMNADEKAKIIEEAKAAQEEGTA